MASKRQVRAFPVAADVRRPVRGDVCFESSVTMQWDYFRCGPEILTSRNYRKKEKAASKCHAFPKFSSKKYES